MVFAKPGDSCTDELAGAPHQGQLLQFGFINWASRYEPSAIFYDNVVFDRAPLEVNLDIKPGSCPNPVNTGSQGVLPVAVLGTADFDVSQIDVDSLRLEGVAPIQSAYDDVAAPFGGEPCGCTTSGPEGLLDLTLKFRTQDVVEAIGATPTGERVLKLTGALLDGTKIEGKDCVVLSTPGGGRPRSTSSATERRRPGRTVIDPGPGAPADSLKPRR